MSHTAVAPRQESATSAAVPVARTTVFDKPRRIAEIVNGRAWVVLRTPNGLRYGEKTEGWEKRAGAFKPLPEGTYKDLVESFIRKHEKGAGMIQQELSLNPNDPIPNVNFLVRDIKAWRKCRVNYIDTGTDWVGFQSR